jgi:hypothetical protein
MLTNLNPGIVFIEDKYINVENLNEYQIDKEHLFILLDYYSGTKDLIRFGSTHELTLAVHKLEKAQQALDFGTVYE